MQPRAIFFIGIPGSGKDTQALLLMEEYGFEQVPSSQLIQEEFEARPDDPEVQREIKRNKDGLLNSPKFVARLIMRFVEPRAKEGAGFVFSGSPRTVEEAEVEIPAMQRFYGEENVILILMDLQRDEARRRITTRRLCKAHKHPIPATPEFDHIKVCPKDGSELYVRELDNPALVDTRFKAYDEETAPTVPIFSAFGVPIFRVDASQSIQGIHQDVVAAIERRQSAPPRE